MIIRDIRIGDKITDGTIVNAYFWSGGKRITVILSTGYAIETDEEELRKWRSVIRRLSEKQSIKQKGGKMALCPITKMTCTGECKLWNSKADNCILNVIGINLVFIAANTKAMRDASSEMLLQSRVSGQQKGKL